MENYPDLEAVLAEARTLGAVEVCGVSTEGREILAVMVGGEGPLVCVTAGLHGLEYIGVQVALEVARRGPIPGARLVVMPVLNPDGYARTWRDRGAGRVRDLRKNARGVDLNRNFPLPHGAWASRLPFAGSMDPDAATYRGQAPLSEAESAAVASWMTVHRPHASANLHSFMGTVIPARVSSWADWRGYGELARAFRVGQGARIGYRRLALPLLDVYTGELEDWQHCVLGCWSVCVESFGWWESLAQHVRAPTGFARFNPREPGPIARRDAGGVRAMLAAAVGLPRVASPRRALLTQRTWRPAFGDESGRSRGGSG